MLDHKYHIIPTLRNYPALQREKKDQIPTPHCSTVDNGEEKMVGKEDFLGRWDFVGRESPRRKRFKLI